MAECQIPVPKRGAPLLFICRYADISLRPDSPEVRRVPGGFEVNLNEVLVRNPPGAYGIIFSETTEDICRQRGSVTVPGANPGIQALIQRKATQHYSRFCECKAPEPPFLCEQYEGLGGANNLYEVVVTFTGTERVQAGSGACSEVPFQSRLSFEAYGPLSKLRSETTVTGVGNCGETYSHVLFMTTGSEFNPCNPREEQIGFVAGSVTGSFAVESIRNVTNVFPEQCPPVPCTLPPPFLGPEPPIPDAEIDDDPPAPLGEEYMTTVYVEGLDGKDGKNVELMSISRFPAGTDVSRFQQIAESDTTKFFDLFLEEELDSELVTVSTGACDIVTGEFTEQVVEAVLPIIANTPGWGSVIAALSQMVFELAKSECKKREPELVDFVGGAVTGSVMERQIVALRPTNIPDKWERYEVFIGISGVDAVLPTTIDIDTFDQLGSEGVFGVAYIEGSGNVVEGEPHLLRFPVSCVHGDWKRFSGVRIALPARCQYGVTFVFKVKPE